MSRRTSHAATAATAAALATAAMAGLASAIGVLLRGDGAVATVTSVRGETYEMATSGVYAWNAQRVVAEGVGWDLFTLLVAVPALVVAAVFVARGSFRGRLVAAGLFGYFLYLYLEYAVTWAFGPLFLLFVATFVVALAGLALVVRDLAADGITGRFAAGYPVRALPALLVAMSLLLSMLWLRRIAEALSTGIDGILMGETTMTVQALDLAVMVPISVAIAAAAWRASDLGQVAAAAYSVTFTAMAAAILSMLLSAWAVEGSAEVGPIVVFASAAAAGAWLAIRALRSAHAEVAVPAPRAVMASPVTS